MVGDVGSRPRLAGIKPAPLCREEGRRSRNMMASNLPSLVRLGMFKSANDAKSRFIHKHMKAAAALAQASPTEGTAEGLPLPRHWGGPPDFPRIKVSEPLAVMTTEAALEEYRQHQRFRRKRGQSSHGRGNVDNAPRQQRSGASTSTMTRRPRLQHSYSEGRLRQNMPHRHQLSNRDHKHDHHTRSHRQAQHYQHPHRQDNHHLEQHKQQNRPPSTHAVMLPQGGGLILVGEDGARKSKFPRGCEHGAETRKVATPVYSSTTGTGEDDVLARLCDPKHFTGTAATGHLPTVVDLEAGVGVLLKGEGIAVKDHIGTQEVSWRLRLAERL